MTERSPIDQARWDAKRARGEVFQVLYEVERTAELVERLTRETAA
jgi:hypothetical protein